MAKKRNLSAAQQAALTAHFESDEGREIQQIIVDGVMRAEARTMILTGEVDPATVTTAELKRMVWARISAAVVDGSLEIAPVVDHSAAILEDARNHIADGRLEYGFVFYSLYLEHVLNRAIRDRGVRLGLTEAEVVEVIRKSMHDKTGVTWLLLHGERMPSELSDDIRRTAATRNDYAHYKWKPNPNADLLHEEIVQAEQQSVATAERAATALTNYVDSLVLPPESEAFEWITRTNRPELPMGDESR